MRFGVRLTGILLCLSTALGLCACGAQAAPQEAPDASDSAAYEAAAETVRREFVQLAEDGMDAFVEEEHPELPWYTAILTRFAENSYFEAYYDFDGNGVPEMIIGAGSEEAPTPIAVYAFDGEKMRYLCKESPLGERARLSRADGLFIVTASGGAASGTLTLYRIAPDGWSTEIVDIVDYQFTDASTVSYSSELGNISREELLARGIPEAVGLDIEPEWNCFYRSGG